MGCSSAPTPDSVRQTLKNHPDILLDAIRAHPEQFVTLLDSIARATQASREAQVAADAARRIENGFAHPFQPNLAHRIAFGSEQAPVTIVEYTDFECPYCRQARSVLVDLMKKYPTQVRLVVKHFPLDFHPRAMPAALMFEAVLRQSPAKALAFYDRMYEKQDQLVTQGDAFVTEAVKAVGADVARAKQDAASPAIRSVVEGDRNEAQRFGFTGTPGFLVNGVPLAGVQSLETFAGVIDRLLAGSTGR
jgi:protein-disulfide isomerase